MDLIVQPASTGETKDVPFTVSDLVLVGEAHLSDGYVVQVFSQKLPEGKFALTAHHFWSVSGHLVSVDKDRGGPTELNTNEQRISFVHKLHGQAKRADTINPEGGSMDQVVALVEAIERRNKFIYLLDEPDPVAQEVPPVQLAVFMPTPLWPDGKGPKEEDLDWVNLYGSGDINSSELRQALAA